MLTQMTDEPTLGAEAGMESERVFWLLGVVGMDSLTGGRNRAAGRRSGTKRRSFGNDRHCVFSVLVPWPGLAKVCAL